MSAVCKPRFKYPIIVKVATYVEWNKTTVVWEVFLDFILLNIYKKKERKEEISVLKTPGDFQKWSDVIV